MSKTMKEDKIRINFELSKELFEKLREKAAEEELTYSAYLRQLIKKAIED
jgi:predicted DNA binding CopG/RHH family protein